MGRFKKIEIEGLLVKNFGKIFVDSFDEAVKASGLPEQEALKKIAPKFNKLLSDYEETISTLYLDKHRFSLRSFLSRHSRNQGKIAAMNKSSFEAFILYVNGCYLIYDKIVAKLKRKKIDNTLKMTVALYGLIVRRADEIVSLLLCGYADGAMIIWRSLYENAVVLLLLALEDDNELADKYFQHSVRNSQKKVNSYLKNHKELKFPPLPSLTEKILESEVKKLATKYGKDFLDNEYGWADSLFPGKQKANFWLLENKVEMSRYRPYYLLCCEHVHPGFNGFRNYMDGNKIILPRLLRQDVELDRFVDPMQFTVSILQEINQYILYEFSIEEEYNVNVLLMRKIFEKQQKTFDKPKSVKRTSKKPN